VPLVEASDVSGTRTVAVYFYYGAYILGRRRFTPVVQGVFSADNLDRF
jgi:hypothetical protein